MCVISASDEREYVKSKASVEIILKYDGEIPCEQNGRGQRDFKQNLRQYFSNRLRRLWRDDENLSHWHTVGLPQAKRKKRIHVIDNPDHYPFFSASMCGFVNVPIVTFHNKLYCALDIKLIGDAAMKSFKDVDNRLKVVLDALRMPRQSSEVPESMQGNGSEQLFCLLEDDSLIKKFCVEEMDDGSSPIQHELIVRATVSSKGFAHPMLQNMH